MSKNINIVDLKSEEKHIISGGGTASGFTQKHVIAAVSGVVGAIGFFALGVYCGIRHIKTGSMLSSEGYTGLIGGAHIEREPMKKRYLLSFGAMWFLFGLSRISANVAYTSFSSAADMESKC